jgi:hypothetical protein
MKQKMKLNIGALIFLGLLSPALMQAQVVSSWNFNNTLTATAGATAIATNAVLGSAIGSGAYNGGTVYFGEDGWPSGSLDPDAYIEFSVAPTAGHAITVASMLLSIRRSTTGTSAGSGPRNWALRSSLDGYATDISNGTLSTGILSVPVTFTASFASLSTAVHFRLYGYNAVVTSGGLNRFVFDNFSISGSAGILPLVFEDFTAIAKNTSAGLSWDISGDENIAAINIQRSTNGSDFEVIGNIPSVHKNGYYAYTDNLNNPSGIYYYRIQILTTDNKIFYSLVQTVSFASAASFSLQAINAGTDGEIRFRITADQSGIYQIGLYDMNGTKLAVKQIDLTPGTKTVQMEHGYIRPGIYLLGADHGGKHQVSKLILQ